MQPIFSVEQLIDTLIYHWSFWEEHEKYYLEDLAPKLVANSELGDEKELGVFKLLREQLSPAEYKEIPTLIAKRREECLRDGRLFKPLRKTVAEWAEEQRRQLDEEKRRVAAAEQAKLQAIKDAAAEKNRILQEKLKREADLKRTEAVSFLQRVFNEDFLRADSIFKTSCPSGLSEKEYWDEKALFVQGWVKKTLGAAIDIDQAAAVGAVNGNILVVARAGSGKTATLVHRAIFLQVHCGVAPNEMLLLAFNKKAADEIKVRLAKVFKNQTPHVMTFHALAYALVHPGEDLLYDSSGGENQGLSRAVQSIIDDYLQDSKYKTKIRELMLVHFREAWDNITAGHYDQSKKELLKFRRALQQRSLGGDFVKSYGEKIIADFLFEYDIDYKYERNRYWNDINYRPDFTLFKTEKTGIIIEYFGLKGDRDYDEQTEEKRKFWHKQKGWVLLEITPKHIKEGGTDSFKKRLIVYLRKHGFPCKRLSENEIWHRVRDRAIDQFTKASVGFIGRCRKQCVTPEALAKMVTEHPSLGKVELMFLPLVTKLYKAYLERLVSTGEEDFDGLLQRASAALNNGKPIFARKNERGDVRKLRYVFIDEFQDFSKLFYMLVSSIKNQNSNIESFCVGDDWQAINAFAGSELKYFQKYEEYFQPSRRLNISMNYRSKQSIVSVGNALMDGLGHPAEPKNKDRGEVLIGDLSAFKASHLERERHPGDVMTPAVLRLVNTALEKDQSVVMLCRINRVPSFINYSSQEGPRGQGLDSFLEMIRSYFPVAQRDKITISTAHRYKGLEKPFVIVLDGIDRSYPLVHPDSIFLRILGDNPEKIREEERRLFYVALTRAAERLVILTEKAAMSPFLKEIQMNMTLSSIDWDFYSPVAGKSSRMVVKVGNQRYLKGAGTFALKDPLKAAGYRWQSTKWPGWVKSYDADDFSMESLRREKWAHSADGIEIRLFNEQEELKDRYFIDRGQWKSAIKEVIWNP